MDPQELWLKQTISADRMRRQVTHEWSHAGERHRRPRPLLFRHVDER